MFSPERWLRPGTPADHIGRQVLALLQSIESAQGTRRRTRYPAHQYTFEATVGAVLANVLNFHLSGSIGHHSGLGIRPGKSQGVMRPARYRQECERGQLPCVLSLMSHPQAQLVAITKGKRGATSRTATLLQPGGGLVALIRHHHPSLNDLDRMPPREVIALKAPRSVDPKQRQRAATWLDYKDTRRTKAWRAEVERLNARLDAADLSVDLGAWPQGVRRMALDLRDRHVVRYFNNARWDHGGRLFGGFWQTMPSASRVALRIGGEPVAVVDYSAMFPRLLYAMAGLDVPPDADLYAVPGFEGHREGIKKVMAALLFRDGLLERLPHGSRGLLPKGTTPRNIEAAIREHHAPISRRLGNGVGFKLMHQESQILLAVLAACADVGLVALPVHDAVIVPRSRATEALDIMAACYRTATGMTPKVSIKGANEEADTLEDSAEMAVEAWVETPSVLGSNLNV